MGKARYVMIGGFLGAGKTTAVLRIAESLRERGQRVGLITNDQSFGLVDTTMLASHGFAVEEITGGCFCCRFGSLVEASEKLAVAERPDVFIAEPVGSCTDLKATVDYPLRRMYGEDYQVAPLSVMVDPIRAERILGLEGGKSFAEKVKYIYVKQLEEAEIIVINKVDLLDGARVERLVKEMRARFPLAEVLTASAREGKGIEQWIERLEKATVRTVGAMAVDYDVYAEGEAMLGWLNATVSVSSQNELDGNELVRQLAVKIQDRLAAQGVEVAHLKMTLSPAEGNDLAVLNLVRNEGHAELSHRLAEGIEEGELIVNLRAEGEPEGLKRVVEMCLDQLRQEGVGAEVRHIESFKPGRPTPIHRLEGVK
jgi:G3E family GTPase